MLVLICLFFAIVCIPVAIIVRGATVRGIYKEAERLSAMRRQTPTTAGGPIAWEVEKAQLIDQVIAGKFGSNGRRLLGQRHIRRKVEAILDRR